MWRKIFPSLQKYGNFQQRKSKNWTPIGNKKLKYITNINKADILNFSDDPPMGSSSNVEPCGDGISEPEERRVDEKGIV